MKHLFICSIGPVQEFIATARRSRDLWYGSWMLSELSKAAAKQIGKLTPPGELIFPYPPDIKALEPASDFNAPNKIVALIDGDPTSIGKEIRQKVKARLDELWADADSHVKGDINKALAQKQIDDLLEFYWVSVPFVEGKDPYSKARESAEALMAARKVTRNFEQVEGSPVPKSSLDGVRESVIPKKEYPEKGVQNSLEKIENLYKNYHARRGEQLSGVDILKRLGNPQRSPKFKSTSDMAAIPFIKQHGFGKELLFKIKALLPEERDRLDDADEGLVFESRFEDAFPSQQLSDEIRKKYTDLFKDFGDVKPSPYYALLAADGDGMGEVIDAQTELQTHRDLSRALSEFAALVPGFVEKSDGVLIYAGGDDVLAYLPLHTVLGFARESEAAFRKKMEKFKTKDGVSPTLSVGIAVTHHLEPLADALELAHKAEKEAKSVPGKNGLAVIVSKRSGTDRTVKDKFAELYERLGKFIEFSEADAISAGTAYELQNLYGLLSKTNIPTDGLAKEALRIIARKRKSGSEEGIEADVKKAFEGWIAPPMKGKQAIRLDELALEMIVARMFSLEETKEAV